MELLCEDICSNILKYLNYYDYAKLYCTNQMWKYMVENYTVYSRLLYLIKEGEYSMKESKKLFYFCCSQNEIELARLIYITENLDISIFRDVFYFEMWNYTDIDTIRSVLTAKGIDVSRYDFLDKEKYFNNIQKILKHLSYSIYRDHYNIVFSNLCIKENETELEDMQILYVFGNPKEINMKRSIERCYQHNKLDCFKFLLSVSSVDNELLEGILTSACNNQRIAFVRKIFESYSISEEIIRKMLKLACYYGNCDIVKFLMEKYQFTIKDKSHSLQMSCIHDKLNCIELLIPSLNQEEINKAFISSCQNESLESIRYLLDNCKICPKIIENAVEVYSSLKEICSRR
jgi:hypothetical protein